MAMPLFLDYPGGVVRRGLYFRPRRLRLSDPVADQLTEERQAGLGLVPVGRGDLGRREANKAVAALQRVVEEAELMVSRQRRKPERQPSQIDRSRVLVDAVQATLRDQST